MSLDPLYESILLQQENNIFYSSFNLYFETELIDKVIHKYTTGNKVDDTAITLNGLAYTSNTRVVVRPKTFVS